MPSGAWALEVGFNFHPIEGVRFMFDYARIRFGDQTRSESRRSRWGDEVIFRGQVAF